MIEIHDLTFAYRTGDPPVLDGIDLAFREGESVALIGANGSGKTTLIRCINGLLTPTGGEVSVDGRSVQDPAQHFEIRRLAGMVFQNPDDQIVSAQVEREIAFGLENLGVPADEMRRRVDETLERFVLARYRTRPPHLLSGGERQRLAVAAVLAMRPRYLLLDEPTALLDPGSRRALLDLLEGLHRSGDVTPIAVTQLPEEAARADRVVALHRGRVALDGPPAHVFSQIDRLGEIGLAAPVPAAIARHIGLSPPLPLTPDALAGRLPDPPGAQPAPDTGPDPAPAAPAIVTAGNLRHVYNPGLPTATVALDGIDLQVPQGARLALIGPSGSGKSTLAQHLNGLLLPTGGDLTVCGIHTPTARDLKPLRRRVGLIFQFPEAQLFAETVFEDVAFGPRNLGLPDVEARAEQALRDVGLHPETFRNRSPFALSGGEKRRVAIAGVLAMRPEILVLDEPTAGLDPAGAAEIESLLLRLNAEGATLILISHDMDLVARIAHRIRALDRGRTAFDAPPAEAFAGRERLLALDLDLPEAVRIADALRGRGWPVPPGALTADALSESLLRLFQK